MANEEKRKTEGSQQAVPDSYLVQLYKRGYAIADVVGHMELIQPPDTSKQTVGFQDSNGRKEVALTFDKQELIAWCDKISANLKDEAAKKA